MESKSYIILNIADTNPTQVVYGVQNDVSSRWAVAQLVDGQGTAWEVPANATPMIRYSKPDGTIGAYDTLEDGSSAFEVDGSVVKFALAAQALTVPGDVAMEMTFFGSGSSVLTTLPFTLRVYPSVAQTRLFASSDYVNLLNSVMSQTAAYASQAQASAETVNGFAAMYEYRELDPVTPSSGVTYANIMLARAYLDASSIWSRYTDEPLPNWISRITRYAEALAYRNLDPVEASGVSYPNLLLTASYLDANSIWSRAAEMQLNAWIASIISRLTTDSEWKLLGGTYASGNYTEYRKFNGLVEMRCNYTAAPNGTASPIGTLPSGYRPSKVLYMPAYVSYTQLGTVNVRQNGVVDFSTPNAGGALYAAFVFAPDA